MGKFWSEVDFRHVMNKRGIVRGVKCTVVSATENNLLVQLDEPKPWADDLPYLRKALGIKRKHQQGANNIFFVTTNVNPVEIKGMTAIVPVVNSFFEGDLVQTRCGKARIVGTTGFGNGTFTGYIVKLLESTQGWKSHAAFPNFRSDKNDLMMMLSWEIKKINSDTEPTTYIVTQVETTIYVRQQYNEKVGIARCHPDDTFDFGLGVEIAKARFIGYKRLLPNEGDIYFRVGQPLRKKFSWEDEKCQNDIIMGNIFRTLAECIAFTSKVVDKRRELVKGALDEEANI